MELEDFLKQNAIYYPEKIIESDVANYLSNLNLIPLAQGSQSRLFKIEGTGWIVKEGRWDIEFDLFSGIKLPIPSNQVEAIFRLFDVTFLPNPETISKQYEYYLQAVNILGLFNENNYFHPKINEIISEQTRIRSSITEIVKRVFEKNSIQVEEEGLDKILQSETINHNFLPKEYLLYGKSISVQNKNRNSYYIFQEKISGELWQKVEIKNLKKEHVLEFLFFLILLLILEDKYKILPDLTPREMATLNWVSKTDNIIVTDQGLKFIDTRWFWKCDGNLVKRGVIIPDIMLSQIKKEINRLLKFLK